MKTNDRVKIRWDMTAMHFNEGAKWEKWMKFAPGTYTWEFEKVSGSSGLCTEYFKGVILFTARYTCFQGNILCLDFGAATIDHNYHLVQSIGKGEYLCYRLDTPDQNPNDCKFRFVFKEI